MHHYANLQRYPTLSCCIAFLSQLWLCNSKFAVTIKQLLSQCSVVALTWLAGTLVRLVVPGHSCRSVQTRTTAINSLKDCQCQNLSAARVWNSEMPILNEDLLLKSSSVSRINHLASQISRQLSTLSSRVFLFSDSLFTLEKWTVPQPYMERVLNLTREVTTCGSHRYCSWRFQRNFIHFKQKTLA